VDYIEKARKTLDIAVYQMDPGYEPLITALLAAQDRGVTVRILLSGTIYPPSDPNTNPQDAEALRALGLEHASVLVVSFDGADTALRIVRAVRGLRSDLPVLVRTEDDSRLEALQAAGATEVVPEIFETSLALVSHVLLFLNVSAREVLETTEDIRHDRYAILRSVFQHRDSGALDVDDHSLRQQLRTVVLPPGAVAVGRTIVELGMDKGKVVVTALRREGIVGRDPDPATRLREGDVLVLWGSPEDLEHGENRLLMG
jgi:CPA2 family monovalent cation:H+ antiporter-2